MYLWHTVYETEVKHMKNMVVCGKKWTSQVDNRVLTKHCVKITCHKCETEIKYKFCI